jgi:hypothetical protein
MQVWTKINVNSILLPRVQLIPLGFSLYLLTLLYFQIIFHPSVPHKICLYFSQWFFRKFNFLKVALTISYIPGILSEPGWLFLHVVVELISLLETEKSLLCCLCQRSWMEATAEFSGHPQ